MSKDVERRTVDVPVIRCDGLDLDAEPVVIDGSETAPRCARTTADFHSEGAVAVVMDPEWAVLRITLDTERHFCSYEHMALWWECTRKSSMETAVLDAAGTLPDPAVFADAQQIAGMLRAASTEHSTREKAEQ